MKKISTMALMLLAAWASYAQDATSTTSSSGGAGGDYAPAAGDFSGALLLGRGNFIGGSGSGSSSGLSSAVPSSPDDPNWTVPGTAPYNNTVDANNNDITNMVGAELRYFVTDNVAIKLSGGAIIRNTPARQNVPGFIDEESDKAAWIPAYASVEADNRVETNGNLGFEYHFSSKYDRLYPYLGVTAPFYYSRQSYYDPTIIDPDEEDPEGGEINVVDIGVRSAEILGFGGQVVGGFDYYLFEGLYFGFEIKPVSVVYAAMYKSPGPGLEKGQADTYTYSFFSQPFLKIGFRF